jgi:hypothetical protein
LSHSNRKKEPSKIEKTIYGPALNKYRIVKRFSPLYNEVHKEAFPEKRVFLIKLVWVRYGLTSTKSKAFKRIGR